MDGFEVGADIARSLKSRAVYSHAWCPKCGKLVAATTTHAGEMWLFEKGGREESPFDFRQSLLEGMFGLPEGEVRSAQERSIARADQENAPMIRPDFAIRLTTLATLFGLPCNRSHPCPHCQRTVVVRVGGMDGTLTATRDDE